MHKFLMGLVCALGISFTLYRCFSDLGGLPVQTWDEKNNINVAQTLTYSIPFPILQLEGEPFFEKPPLWYYVASIVNRATGGSISAMRGISAISGFFIIITTAWIAWKRWGSVAGTTTWILLLFTHHLYVNNPNGIFSTHTFRSADLDGLFILFFFLSFVANYITFSSTSKGLVAGFLSGLAVLTKGPLGLLPLIFLPKKSILYALVACIITVAPWYMYMIFSYQWPFISTHIGYHLVGRSIYPLEGHNNPWWYYISIITNHSFFVSWELLVASYAWIIHSRSYLSDSLIRSASLMLVLCLVIPSVMQTRLAWYILPAYPFAALIIGVFCSTLYSRICKTLIWYSKNHD